MESEPAGSENSAKGKRDLNQADGETVTEAGLEYCVAEVRDTQPGAASEENLAAILKLYAAVVERG
jgi:hypothetical protein